MPGLICDACGAPLVSHEGGIMKCNYCGLLHTPERISQKIQEIKGTVEVTKGNVEKERLLRNAKYFTQNGEYGSANATFDTLLFDYPEDPYIKREYWIYRIRERIDQKKDVKDISPMDIQSDIEILNMAKKYRIDTDKYSNFLIQTYKSFTGETSRYGQASNWHTVQNNPNSTDIPHDEYGLSAIWKLKVMIYDLQNSIHNHQDRITDNQRIYDETLARENEQNRKKDSEVIGNIIMILLPIINVVLLSVSYAWGFAFLLTLPAGGAGILSFFVSNNKYSDHSGSNRYSEYIAHENEALDSDMNQLATLKRVLSEKEPAVFKKLSGG